MYACVAGIYIILLCLGSQGTESMFEVGEEESLHVRRYCMQHSIKISSV